MSTLTGFDRKADYEQGRSDALLRLPRSSTRAFYRKGYDAGVSELCRKDKVTA